MPLKGLYIEDDPSNILTYKELFAPEGLEIVSVPQLPLAPEDIYPMVMDADPDFLLIDHELNKRVAYTGYDALREIRKQDSTIFAVLLTNFPVQDFKNEFGIYDLEVRKGELDKDEKIDEVVQKIKRACMRASEDEVLAHAEENRRFAEESLEILRQIHKKVTETT